MQIVLGLDAAWGGMGWCLAHGQGPIASGHVALGGATWRWAALDVWLRETLTPELVDADMLRGPDDPRIGIVIEEPPMVYAGAGRGGKGMAGNQAAVGYGLGRLAGALELWSYQRGDLGYPWLVNPRTWRGWWRVGGKGRDERKAAAVAMVRSLGWRDHLTGHRWVDAGGGPKADVAEAILIAVGAAQRPAEAPIGPRRRQLALPVRSPPATSAKQPRA